MKTKRTQILLIAGALWTAGFAFAETNPRIVSPEETPPAVPKVDATAKTNVIEVASSRPELSIFVKAVKSAGLEMMLNEEGPFIIFAPTDEAFKKLPEGVLQDLLRPEHKVKLVHLLSRHVVSGQKLAEHLEPGEWTSAEGAKLTVTREGETIRVEGAKVVKQDLAASNGMIHGIDKVLMPAK